jgi:hypothetical protein
LAIATGVAPQYWLEDAEMMVTAIEILGEQNG